MKKIIISFLLMITLVCNCPISAYASSFEDVANELYLSSASMGNVFRYILEEFGVVLNPSLWGTGSMNERFQEYLTEQALITDSDSYMNYLRAHLPVSEDESGEITYSADTEIVNNLYNFAVETIKEETPWYTHQTALSRDIASFYVDSFATSTQYNAFIDFLNDNPDKMVYVSDFVQRSVSIYDENLVDTGVDISGVNMLVIDNDCDIVATSYRYGMYNFEVYDKNWEKVKLKVSVMDENGVVHDSNATDSPLTYITGIHYYSGNKYFDYEYKGFTTSMTVNGLTVVPIKSAFFVTSNGANIRLYKSLADLKQYTVGQRPYYITDAFNSYDSTVDNSTTITQTQIDNSVTYGDVYNYITNNYENPDGLSEDELRAILAEYLSQINNNNSGGGSGGSDNGSGSGGGLSGFLDGLGSIGNAIMAILGKLMEILGSAIELVTGAITDLITIIPNSIGELLGALFPVFPEEWIKAITLSLVLGVVVGIVRMFK